MSDAKRRVYVDCQVFQYHAWGRGMGRYTLKLLSALDKQGIGLTLILNKNIDFPKDRLETITQECPSANILYLGLSENPGIAGGWLKLQSRCMAELDSQLAGVLQPDDTYLIASHFALRYCSTFPSLACRKALLFYDLTPYLQWSEFKTTPDFEPKKYFAQFKTLFDADELWAISQSAAEEVIYWLGIDPRRVKNIRGASIRNDNEPLRRPGSLNPKTKFLLSPTADGPHKNNENMVRAFAAFNERTGGAYKLVVTSGFSDQSKAALSEISKDVIYSGHVSDGELGWLYEHCEALLFVSKTEGLGLPILEAVTAGKKVVCSDIKVFKEISGEAFYFANPSSSDSIADALQRALIVGEDWEKRQKHYADIGRTFSWKAVSQLCVELMETPLPTDDNRDDSPAFYYSDADGAGRARDVAELLFALNQTAEFRVEREPQYGYNFPSYLVDIGVASSVFAKQEATPSSPTRPIFIIDDTTEGGQLLWWALQTPGLVVATFSQKHVPTYIEDYLETVIGSKVSYKAFRELVEAAGNQLIHLSQLSRRGTPDLVHEVALLDKQIKKKETA